MTIIIKGALFTGGMQITHNTAPVIPVDSVSAGEAQTVLCSSMIFLNGSVVGGLNNVFLWEQTSGTPVTIDDPTSLVTFFLNAGGDDLTFRLWVDQSTVNETYDDTEVTRTPSTWTRTVYGNVTKREDAFQYDAGQNWKYYTAERGITDIEFNPALPTWPPPEDADNGLGCPDISVADPQAVMSWNLPVDNYGTGSQTYADFWLVQYVSILIEKYNTTSMEWELDAEIFGENGVRTYVIEYDETYRLGAKYNYGVTPVFIQYTDSFITTDDGLTLIKTPWAITRTAQGGGGAYIAVVDRFTSISRQEEVNTITATGDGGARVANVSRLTAISRAEEVSTITAYGNANARSFTVTRSDGNSIGG